MTTSVVSPSDRLATLPGGVPDLTLGWEAIRWASKYLRHPNGPRVGERWQFIDSQIRFLLWFYALDESGRWLFNHAVRRLAKGSGKSPFAAVMALVEFCGPVRLKDFEPKLPGGVVGRPVDMPLVQIAATAQSQTANTMRMVRALCQRGSRLVVEHNIDVGKEQFYRTPEGTLEVITSSAAAAEGAEATFVVGDETEHWTPRNGGQVLASTLGDNVGKTESRMLETCNSWVPGTESVAEESWDRWVAQESGRTASDRRTLYDARVAPPQTDLADRASLVAGLTHVYDDCFWVPIESHADRILSGQTKPDDARRKYLNQPTAVANAWVTQQDWQKLADPRPLEDGDAIVMFFDGSKSRDATALIGCRIDDGYTFTFEPRSVWEPLRDGWSVPVAEVDAMVEQAFERFDVWAFFADVQEWQQFALTTWPDRYGEKLRVWAQPTGKDAQPIAWDMRRRTFEFTKAVELVEEEIYAKAFAHDGSEVLSRHVANARRKLNKYGYSIGKDSPDSPLKVDAGVAMVGARMVRRLVANSDTWKQKRDRIEGVLVLT